MPTGKKARHAGPLLALVVLVPLLFMLSLGPRLAVVGQTPLGMAGWNAAGSAWVAEQWQAEGPLRLRLGMYWDGPHVETPTLAERAQYVSFPPGAIVLLYSYAQILGQTATPALAQVLSLLLQCAVAVTLALLTYLLLMRFDLGRWRMCAMALVPGLAYCWLPAPYYEHAVGYFSDQAVILPWVTVVGLESLRASHSSSYRYVIVFAVSFIGLMVDWLFLCVGVVLAATHLMCLCSTQQIESDKFKTGLRLIRAMLLVAAPYLAALAAYALLLSLWGAWSTLVERATLRASEGSAFFANVAVEAPGGASAVLAWLGLDTVFWSGHFGGSYGVTGYLLVIVCFGLLLVTATGVLWRRWRAEPLPEGVAPALVASAGLLLPPLLYYFLLPGHNNQFLHTFTALKWAVPLAVVPIVGVGMLLSFLELRPRIVTMGVLAAALLLGGYTASLHGERVARFAQLRPVPHTGLASFIGAHTGYWDVVVTPRAAWGPKPPQLMRLSRKRVHDAGDPVGLRALLADMPAETQLVLVRRAEDTWGAPWDALAAPFGPAHEDGAFVLHRVPRARALDVLARER